MRRYRIAREHGTAASRIMLPTYVALFGGAGLAFLIQAPLRTSGPAYEVATAWFGIRWWGVGFLVIASVSFAGLASRWMPALVLGLVLGAGTAGFWGALIEATAFRDPHVSFSGGMWITTVAIAQVASLKSLILNETDLAG